MPIENTGMVFLYICSLHIYIFFFTQIKGKYIEYYIRYLGFFFFNVP